MNEITLHKLTCNESQEDVDECLLEVYLDGSTVREPYPLTQSMSSVGDATDEWEIDRTYLFDTGVQASLVEEDLFEFTRDTLGTADLALLSGTGTASFTGDGADYTLTYSVVTDLNQSQDPSLNAVLDFDASNESIGWRDLNKRDIVNELQILIDRTDADNDGVPDAMLTIDQMGTPFCGPAAIMVAMAWRFPRRLVECCRAIWEKGYFLGKDERIEASTELRQSKSGFYMNKVCNTPNVCWMFLATIRDEESWLDVGGGDDEDWAIIDFPGNVNQVVYANWPWLMTYWLSNIAGFEGTMEGKYVVLSYTVRDALQAAGTAKQNGGVGVLLVNSNLPKDSVESPDLWDEGGGPNHWVTFIQDTPPTSSGNVSFDCQSWGARKHIDKSESIIDDQVWGVFTAEP